MYVHVMPWYIHKEKEFAMVILLLLFYLLSPSADAYNIFGNSKNAPGLCHCILIANHCSLFGQLFILYADVYCPNQLILKPKTMIHSKNLILHINSWKWLPIHHQFRGRNDHSKRRVFNLGFPNNNHAGATMEKAWLLVCIFFICHNHKKLTI